MKKIIFLISIIFLFSCKQEEVKLEIPLLDIGLVTPANEFRMDLNDLEADAYEFRWVNKADELYTLYFSTSEDLTNAYTIDVGATDHYSLSGLEAEITLSALKINTGVEAKVYWTVKPATALTSASLHINYVVANRMDSRLTTPVDLSEKVLDYEKSDNKVRFAWDTTGLPEGSTYSISFSDNLYMTGNIYTIGGINSNGVEISEGQLQEILEELSEIRYDYTSLYWSVEQENDHLPLSRVPFALNLHGMMILRDVRGDETEIYRVVKLDYGDGTSRIWTAENLRATYYADGTPIEDENILWAPQHLDEVQRQAYGVHYKTSIRNRITPANWVLPTMAEYVDLFDAARRAGSGYQIIKHPEYYSSGISSPEQANKWGLGLVASGQWMGDAITNYDGPYCYLLTSDQDENACILHDGGDTLWEPWTTGAPVRMIYTGK